MSLLSNMNQNRALQHELIDKVRLSIYTLDKIIKVKYVGNNKN